MRLLGDIRRFAICCSVAVLAALLAPLVGLFARAVHRDGISWTWFARNLMAWQTLYAGVIAGVAAVATISVILLQIWASDELERKRLRRRNEAIRAVLPLSLTQICDYAAICAQAHAMVLIEIDRDPEKDRDPIIPDLPQGLDDRMIEFIESSDEATAKAFQKFLAILQIQHTRSRAQPEQVGSRITKARGKYYHLNRISDAADVYAMASSFFRYARGKADAATFDITPQDKDGAVLAMGLSFLDEDAARQYIRERKPIL